MRIGFIGLGNVGSKLAGSLVRNGFDVTVRDCVAAGAQLLVVGSALFRHTGYTPTVQQLTELASQV